MGFSTSPWNLAILTLPTVLTLTYPAALYTIQANIFCWEKLSHRQPYTLLLLFSAFCFPSPRALREMSHMRELKKYCTEG